MRWLEIVIKWSPVIGPWVNIVLMVLLQRVMRRAHQINVKMAEENHDFSSGLAQHVIDLQMEVARLKALAGLTLEE
jgi:hypothetical protein